MDAATLLGPVADATMSVAGLDLTVRVPPASAARLVLRCTWLDARKGRHWSPQHLVALAYNTVSEADHANLSALVTARRPPVPAAVMRDAVTWAVEQATGRPFGDVHGLSAWLTVHERRLAGRLLLSGAPVADRSLADVLDMADAAVHEYASDVDVRRWLDEAWESRDNFGEDATARAGTDAFMKMVRGEEQ